MPGNDTSRDSCKGATRAQHCDPMEVSFREGAEKDAQGLARLGHGAFEAAFGAHNSPKDMEDYLRAAFTTDQLLAEIRDPRASFLLACERNELLGFAKLIASPAPECVTESGPAVELERLYIDKDKTGQGVGSTLLESAIRFAARKAFNAVWLGVWEHNDGAIRFYERHGFRAVGTKRFNLGSDLQTDIIMERACSI